MERRTKTHRARASIQVRRPIRASRAPCCFQLPQLPKLPQPEDVDGAAGAWMGVVRNAKTVIDIFPPLSLGLGAGIAIGCGFGWNIKAMVGPPRAFCGPGVGFGIGVGYGQGPYGKRFGADKRNEESLRRIEAFERKADSLVQGIVDKLNAMAAKLSWE